MADPIAQNTQVTPEPVASVAQVTAAVTPPEASPTPAQVVTSPAVVAELPKTPETPPTEPATGPTAAVETVPGSEPASEAKPLETLLGEPVKPAVEPAPVDNKPEAKAPETNNEGGQTEQAPPPSYEPFALPDDVKLDDVKVGEFTKLLSDLELSGKADHAAVQQFGQKAVDFHVSEVKRVVEDYTKAITTAWDKQKTDWKESFLKDPDIGGNRSQTTVDAARNFIRSHGGTEEQQTEFRSLMESSGLGNHPAMIRILASAYRDLAEGKPLAATMPVSAPKSKTQTLYGKN